ncbi:hypothetical protein EDD85DRAFT_792380 [Armillaria nabsnona]|nr:hypothetical protein EDD85DRAFT_792380 [Armillaria nabsnona]
MLAFSLLSLTFLISSLLYFPLSQWHPGFLQSCINLQGVKSVMKLALSVVINIFIPKPTFYIGKWIGRQLFFEEDKMKQKLQGKHSKVILDEALCHFGIDVWWSGVCMLTILGFDAAGNIVFTAELANRMVDSEAWVYRVNQSKETFDTSKYARVLIWGKDRSGSGIRLSSGWCLPMMHVVPSVRHSVYLQTQISDTSTIRSLLDASTKKALVMRNLTRFNIISSTPNPEDLSTLILLLPASTFGTS